MILYYIRHGEPIYSPDQLTPLGHLQAKSVAKRLERFGVDEVYASTSIRAMQTAQPTCDLLGKEMKTLDWMHEELAWEELSLPVNETKNQWVWAHPVYSQILTRRDVREMGDRWYDHPELCKFGFGRAFQRIGTHTDELLAGFGYEHDRDKGLYRITTENTEKRIAIFAHEGFGKVFLSELLDIPYPYFAQHFELRHAGFTAILFDKGFPFSFDGYARARLMTLSNDAHLYHDDLPPLHVSTSLRQNY